MEVVQNLVPPAYRLPVEAFEAYLSQGMMGVICP